MMPFQPSPGQELTIDTALYRVAEHPTAPGFPFGQEGRQAIVYQLVQSGKNEERIGEDTGSYQAIKIFRPRFRTPALVMLGDLIAPFASLPGLQVCQRVVLTPSRHTGLLKKHSDLIYSVLMPWVEGPVWQEILLEKRPLTRKQSLSFARALARVLLGMEERGIAHCDLSAPNLILSPDLDRPSVELVDVEGIYAPGLPRPNILPAGSPGYAHKVAPSGLWRPEADRFAGAVLLAEILGWSDPDLRQAAWGENYFSVQEMQSESERYQVLVKVLRRDWGDRVTNLLTRSWHSDTLLDCPTLGEWFVALPESVPELAIAVEPQRESTPITDTTRVLRLIMQAEQAAGRGEHRSALNLYHRALRLASPELKVEITSRIGSLESALGPGGVSCPNCGRAVPPEMKTCPYCEELLTSPSHVKAAEQPGDQTQKVWRCPNCSKFAPENVDRCPFCEIGQRISPESAGELPDPIGARSEDGVSRWRKPSWFIGGLAVIVVIFGLMVVPALTNEWNASRRPDYMVILQSDQAEVLARFEMPKERLIELGYQVRILESGAESEAILYGAESGIDAIADLSGQLRPLVDLNGLPVRRFDADDDAYQKRNIVVQIQDAERFSDHGSVPKPAGEPLEMVFVPAGTLVMGAADGEADERPVHTVVLDDYWIARTEISNRQFTEFLNQVGNQPVHGITWLDLDDPECPIEEIDGRFRPKNGLEEHPVTEITWFGAAAFCQWVGLELPTEAEWEYAARGPSASTYPWGEDEPSCSLAQFDACPGGIAIAGTYPSGASWCGALDMAGNVWEWVADWYHANTYSDAPRANPIGPSSGSARVLRGGSAQDGAKQLRAAERFQTDPSAADAFIGFRCVNRAPGPDG